jgi:ribosomal protein S18 acetylase RimI-like enzyme
MERVGDLDPLDSPILFSLSGAHRHLAVTLGAAMRYPAAVSPYMALPADAADADWSDLAQLAAGDEVVIFDIGPRPPSSWEVTWRRDLFQMTGVNAVADDVTRVVRLGEDDASEMLALAERTKPGPFALRTPELGAYYGVRRDGRLVGMAGERLRPDGWTEVSAVCTEPAFRGQGLATELMSAVVDGIRERGDAPFLHVLAQNQRVVDLYLRLGFIIRREIAIMGLQPSQ